MAEWGGEGVTFVGVPLLAGDGCALPCPRPGIALEARAARPIADLGRQ
jgi:hypothetical protein